jgi:hypothetical protein
MSLDKEILKVTSKELGEIGDLPKEEVKVEEVKVENVKETVEKIVEEVKEKVEEVQDAVEKLVKSEEVKTVIRVVEELPKTFQCCLPFLSRFWGNVKQK